MKNLVLAFLISVTSSQIFAKEVETKKKLTNYTPACRAHAANGVLGIVRGIIKTNNPDLQIQLDEIQLEDFHKDKEVAWELYAVKVVGKGFTSRETSGVWKIKMYEAGDGCMFESIGLHNRELRK